MIQFKQMICPISTERVDENRVRATALGVVITMGAYLITGYSVLLAILVIDFSIRAFTTLKYSPYSWLAQQLVNLIGTQPVWIDKAPKVFAARIGFLLTAITAVSAVAGSSLLAVIMGSTLVAFSFMECGLNFCAGCWIYTYVVYPLVRKK